MVGYHTFVQFSAAIFLFLRWDHNSPTITSKARVTAKSVRSIVLPAKCLGLTTLPLRVSIGTSSMKAELFLVWRNFRLNQAAMKAENHFASL